MAIDRRATKPATQSWAANGARGRRRRQGGRGRADCRESWETEGAEPNATPASAQFGARGPMVPMATGVTKTVMRPNRCNRVRCLATAPAPVEISADSSWRAFLPAGRHPRDGTWRPVSRRAADAGGNALAHGTTNPAGAHRRKRADHAAKPAGSQGYCTTSQKVPRWSATNLRP